MSNYKIAFDYALKELHKSDPAVVVKNSLAEYCSKNRQYVVPFFKQPHVVELENGKIYRQDDGCSSSLGVGTMIMHYLTFAQDITPSGRLISLKEVPDCGIFFPAFQKAVIQPLAQTFGENLENFKECAAMLGGEEVKLGHAAARFEAFPKVPLTVAIWSGDEEVKSSASFLFDSTVEHFSPGETIIGYGYFIVHKLLNYSCSTGHSTTGKEDYFFG